MLEYCDEESDCKRLFDCQFFNQTQGICKPWIEVIPHFKDALIGFSIYCGILFFGLFIFGCVRLIRRIVLHKRFSLDVCNLSVLCLITGCLVRGIEGSYNPHGLRHSKGVPLQVETILFYTIYLFWLYGAYLLELFWVELVHAKKMRVDLSIIQMRPLLYGFLVITILITLPLMIWYGINQSAISELLLSISFAVFSLSQIVLSIVYGYKLSKVAKSPEFTKRMIRFLSVVDTLLLICVILGVVLSFTYAAWQEYAIMVVMKLLEFILLAMWITFVSRGPSQQTSSHDSSSGEKSNNRKSVIVTKNESLTSLHGHEQ